MAILRPADLNLYRRLLRQARPYLPHIALIFLLDLLGTPLLLLTPIPLKIAVDNGIGSAPLPRFLGAVLPSFTIRSARWLLLTAAFLQALLVLLGQLQDLRSYIFRTSTGEKLTRHFRSQVVERRQRP